MNQMNQNFAEFKNNNINNLELKLKNGKYIGQIINGLREGKGIMLYNNGSRYEGEFKNNKKEGKGIIYYNDGSRYEGDFFNNKKEGKGIMYYNNGDRMMGDYYNDKEVGQHVILTNSGEIKPQQFISKNKLYGMGMIMQGMNLRINNSGMGMAMGMQGIQGIGMMDNDDWLEGFKMGVEEAKKNKNELNKGTMGELCMKGMNPGIGMEGIQGMGKMDNDDWLEGFKMGVEEVKNNNNNELNKGMMSKPDIQGMIGMKQMSKEDEEEWMKGFLNGI